MTRRKRLRVAVCGSRSFPLTPEVGAQVVDILRGYPEGTVFLTRGSEGFDEFVLRACGVLGLPVEARPGPGGRENFVRDAALALEADVLLAFLDPRTLHREDTGTAHLVSKFLDKKRKTNAYTAHESSLVFVGSSD